MQQVHHYSQRSLITTFFRCPSLLPYATPVAARCPAEAMKIPRARLSRRSAFETNSRRYVAGDVARRWRISCR